MPDPSPLPQPAPSDQLPLLEAALLRPLPQAIRINPLKHQAEMAIKDLANRYGWQWVRSPFARPAGRWKGSA